ncbi:MAG TPA: hypothetical protein VFM18_03250 [Methanosarcina sp.]|nr:hypothetical protein [Methanosarcina sp.]
MIKKIAMAVYSDGTAIPYDQLTEEEIETGDFYVSESYIDNSYSLGDWDEIRESSIVNYFCRLDAIRLLCNIA